MHAHHHFKQAGVFIFFRSFVNKQNVFEVETLYRTYYIQADNHEEMMEWIKAFKQVIRSIKGKSTVVSFS